MAKVKDTFVLGQPIIYRPGLSPHKNDPSFLGWIVGLPSTSNIKYKKWKIFYNTSQRQDRLDDGPYMSTLVNDSEEFAYTEAELSNLENRIPFVYFILARMNPPTPGHVEGLSIPFIHIIATHIFFQTFIGIKETPGMSSEYYISQKQQYKSIEELINIIENIQNIDDSDKQQIIIDLESLYNKISKASSIAGLSNNPLQAAEQTNESEVLNNMSDFIENYSGLANIDYRIFLTLTNNKERLIQNQNNPEKIDQLLDFIKQPNDKSIADKKSMLGNPLTFEEKCYFLKKILFNIGIRNISFLNKLINENQKHCSQYGIKSAIRCSMALQIQHSQEYDPSKIIYYYSKDDFDEVRKYCDVNKSIINDQPPNVKCVILNRSATRQNSEISATHIKDSYFSNQNITQGDNTVDQTYSPSLEIEYLTDQERNCLKNILKNRLIFKNSDGQYKTDESIIDTLQNQTLDEGCEDLIREIKKGPGPNTRLRGSILDFPMGYDQGLSSESEDEINRMVIYYNQKEEELKAQLKNLRLQSKSKQNKINTQLNRLKTRTRQRPFMKGPKNVTRKADLEKQLQFEVANFGPLDQRSNTSIAQIGKGRTRKYKKSRKFKNKKFRKYKKKSRKYKRKTKRSYY